MINERGFRCTRYPEIIKDLSHTLRNEFSNVIDLGNSSLIGNLVKVMSLTEANINELAQSVYDSTNLLSAEGVLLDNIILLMGFTRLPASSTMGIVYLTGDEGITVTEGSNIQSVLGDIFYINSSVTLSAVNCVQCSVSIDVLEEGVDYTLEVGEIGNTNVYRTPYRPNQTKQDILLGLLELIIADEELISSFLSTKDGEPVLVIRKTNIGQNMSVSGSSYFGYHDVTTPTLAVSLFKGYVPINPFSIKFTMENGVYAENRSLFVSGRSQESDVQLRHRVLSSYQAESSGSSYIAMEKAINAIPDVTYVKVLENTSAQNTNVPKVMSPKSFQVVVENGDNFLIANAIWENKPAGIMNFCDVTNPLTQTVTIQDYNGQSHIVRFLRPQTVFIWIHAEYNLYSEEEFPVSGEMIMREEMAGYGQDLPLGKDVIPDRFYSSVYSNVSGVNDLVIYVAKTSSINEVPVFPTDYTTDTIVITDEQTTNFSAFGEPARTTVRGWGNQDIPAVPVPFERDLTPNHPNQPLQGNIHGVTDLHRKLP